MQSTTDATALKDAAQEPRNAPSRPDDIAARPSPGAGVAEPAAPPRPTSDAPSAEATGHPATEALHLEGHTLDPSGAPDVLHQYELSLAGGLDVETFDPERHTLDPADVQIQGEIHFPGPEDAQHHQLEPDAPKHPDFEAGIDRVPPPQFPKAYDSLPVGDYLRETHDSGVFEMNAQVEDNLRDAVVHQQMAAALDGQVVANGDFMEPNGTLARARKDEIENAARELGAAAASAAQPALTPDAEGPPPGHEIPMESYAQDPNAALDGPAPGMKLGDAEGAAHANTPKGETDAERPNARANPEKDELRTQRRGPEDDRTADGRKPPTDRSAAAGQPHQTIEHVTAMAVLLRAFGKGVKGTIEAVSGGVKNVSGWRERSMRAHEDALRGSIATMNRLIDSVAADPASPASLLALKRLSAEQSAFRDRLAVYGDQVKFGGDAKSADFLQDLAHDSQALRDKMAKSITDPQKLKDAGFGERALDEIKKVAERIQEALDKVIREIEKLFNRGAEEAEGPSLAA